MPQRGGWLLGWATFIDTQGVAEYGRRETRDKGVVMVVSWTLGHAILGTDVKMPTVRGRHNSYTGRVSSILEF